MTLNEILKAVDELSPDERRQLRDYLDQQEQPAQEHRAGTMDINALMRAVDEFREGLTEEELDEMIALMNEEYIELWDESEWQE